MHGGAAAVLRDVPAVGIVGAGVGRQELLGEIKPAAEDDAARAVERSRSAGHAHAGYRATGRVPPALDPPSPRVAVCGFCRLFVVGGGNGKGRDGGSAKAKGRRH